MMPRPKRTHPPGMKRRNGAVREALRMGPAPQPDAKRPPRHVVRISRHEAEAFSWEIYREAGPIEIHRSTRLFVTRIETIVDSAREAAALEIAVVKP
jgi:hypothetical protein